MTRRTFISMLLIPAVLIAAIVAGSLAAQHARANDDQSGAGWEYLIVQGGNVNLASGDGGSMRKESGPFSRESFPLEKNMDKLGAKGWELIAVTGSPGDPIFYFKRRK
ncbi:MAG TPA: hypothetical protein VFB82_16520 [Blastocatellia bacterium]|nr:hypothetical protein [Blastocatellia bacterium]